MPGSATSFQRGNSLRSGTPAHGRALCDSLFIAQGAHWQDVVPSAVESVPSEEYTSPEK